MEYEQGKRHKRQKRLCIPSFEQGRSMASFLVAVQEEADVLSREWRARAGTDGKVTSPTSPIYLATSRLYLPQISLYLAGEPRLLRGDAAAHTGRDPPRDLRPR